MIVHVPLPANDSPLTLQQPELWFYNLEVNKAFRSFQEQDSVFDEN